MADYSFPGPGCAGAALKKLLFSAVLLAFCAPASADPLEKLALSLQEGLEGSPNIKIAVLEFPYVERETLGRPARSSTGPRPKYGRSCFKEMYFVKKPFAPEWIAAHSMYLFKFAKSGVTDSSGREISNLLLSIEDYLREGQEYSLEAGVKSQLDIVWLLATWEDYLGRMVQNKERMIPYRLKLKPEAMRQLLVESLRQAAVNRAGEKYHLVTNNCTNNLVILLNRVLPREQKISLWTNKGYDLNATLPNAVPEYLTKLGYLEAPMAQIDAASYLPGTDWPGGYPAAAGRR